MRSRPDKNSGEDKPKRGGGKAKPFAKGRARVPGGFKKPGGNAWNKEEKGGRSGSADYRGKPTHEKKNYRDDDRPRRSYDKAEGGDNQRDDKRTVRPYVKPGERGDSRRDDSRPRRSYDKSGEGGDSRRDDKRPGRSYDKSSERGDSRRDDSKPRRSYDKSGEGSDSRDEKRVVRPYVRRGERDDSHRDDSKPRRSYDKSDESRGGSGEERAPRRPYTDKREGRGEGGYKRSSEGREDSAPRGGDKPGHYSDDRPKRRWDDADGSRKKDFGKEGNSEWKKSGEEKYKGRNTRDDHKPYRDKTGSYDSRRGTEKPKGEKGFNAEGTIRLNKYIANSGVCSRREADDLIISGAVTINGEVVTQLGTRITREDKVEFGGETLNIEKKVYLVLNKPKGYITTVDDPPERNTVMLLVKDACRERIYPVGRLDRNTTGLLLLTNDGDVTKKLTHPSHRVRKVYHVELDKALTKADMERLTEGIELEDGMMAVDEIAYTGKTDDKKNIGVVIHSGRNRIVRRLFEALEYNIVKLDRVAFANLTKKDLPRGKWRMLDQNEINTLMMI